MVLTSYAKSNSTIASTSHLKTLHFTKAPMARRRMMSQPTPAMLSASFARLARVSDLRQNLKCTHAHEIHYLEHKREVSRSNLRELHFTQLTLLGE
jgi:hypothetical protein